MATNATPLVQQCEAIATTFPNEAFQGMARILGNIIVTIIINGSPFHLFTLSTLSKEIIEYFSYESLNTFILLMMLRFYL